MQKLLRQQELILQVHQDLSNDLLKRLRVRTDYRPCDKADKTAEAYRHARDCVERVRGAGKVHIQALNYYLEAEVEFNSSQKTLLRDKLPEVLAGIYPTDNHAKRLLRELKLERRVQTIDWGGSPQLLWTNCLNEMAKDGYLGVDDLLYQAREEYPNNQPLRDLDHECKQLASKRKGGGESSADKRQAEEARESYYASILNKLAHDNVTYTRILQHPAYRTREPINLRGNYSTHYNQLKVDFDRGAPRRGVLDLRVAEPMYPISFVLIEQEGSTHPDFPCLILQVDQVIADARHEVAGYLFIHDPDRAVVDGMQRLFQAVHRASRHIDVSDLIYDAAKASARVSDEVAD